MIDDENYRLWLQMLKDAEAKYANVHIVRFPPGLICPNGICQHIVDGINQFMDPWHLSQEYAVHIQDIIDDMLSPYWL